MDDRDHSGHGKNDHIWNIFGNGLSMGGKGKISHLDPKVLDQSNPVNVCAIYTEIEEWVVWGDFFFFFRNTKFCLEVF